MGKENAKQQKPIDFGLLLSVITLTLIGVVMVYSASAPEATLRFDDGAYYVKRHAMWAFFGMFVFFGIMHIDYHLWKKYSFFLYIVAIFLGLMVYTPLGIELKGARRWIDIGFGTLMPSDAIKIATIMFYATFLEKKRKTIKTIKKGTLPSLVIIGIPVIIIFLQPDFSTSAALAAALFGMYFVGGMHLGWMLVLPPAAAGFFYFAVMGEEYRMRRVTAFLDPFADKLGSGWQIVQSLYALGAGGIFGSGLGQSKQKYFYISESYNDFIFAIIGEEWGLVGTAFVLFLYAYIISKGIVIAVNAKDYYGTYLASGITAIFALQALINIGTVTSSIPATGITLPLVSYGGTSLVIYLASMAILLNISKHQKSNSRKTMGNGKGIGGRK